MKKSELIELIKECIKEETSGEKIDKSIRDTITSIPGGKEIDPNMDLGYLQQWAAKPSAVKVDANTEYNGYKIGDKVKVKSNRLTVASGTTGRIVDFYFNYPDKRGASVAIRWDGGKSKFPQKYDGSILNDVVKI